MAIGWSRKSLEKSLKTINRPQLELLIKMIRTINTRMNKDRMKILKVK